MSDHKRKGRLKTWDDAKGFGFIQPASSGAEVFAPISVMRRDRRPQPGDEVLFIEGRDERGRPHAEHLRLAGELSLDHQSIRRKPKATGSNLPARRKPATKSLNGPATPGSIQYLSSKVVVFLLLCTLLVLGALQQLLGKGGWWLLPLYLLAGLLSFVQYWLDKYSAQRGGQQTLRRKTRRCLSGGFLADCRHASGVLD